MSQVCSQIVLKCLCLARIGRVDFFLSVNKFTRAATKRTDKRLARLISYTHHTREFRQQCHAQHNNFRLELFQDWKTRSQHQEEFCAFSEVTCLCQSVGCARNRPQFHTVQRKLK